MSTGLSPSGVAGVGEGWGEEAARTWVQGFVDGYNHRHRHRGIRFVTPHERHEGLDVEILANRARVYETARRTSPKRWTGAIRDWSPIGGVWLNPERDCPVTSEAA
jgi:putative transposase